MKIATIDCSASTGYVPNYDNNIYAVLSALTPPFRIIRWSCDVVSDVIIERVLRERHCQSISCGGTIPSSFIKVLPSDTTPFQLYIFTDGLIRNEDVDECSHILKSQNINIEKVYLYYIGELNNMNLMFTSLFNGIPQEVHINEKYIGRVFEPRIQLDFTEFDYHAIMRDDTLKLTVLNRINIGIDKCLLKKQLLELETQILVKYFKDKKISIRDFYERKDVDGCIQYLKKHSYYWKKAKFQKKMADVLQLFDENINTHSMNLFKDTPKIPLQIDESLTAKKEGENGKKLDEDVLDRDVLYQKCKLSCIPVKLCKNNNNDDDIRLYKELFQNPFKLLESPELLLRRVTGLIEPFVPDYQDAYSKIKNNEVSSFTRDQLVCPYILHHEDISFEALLKHNDYVLSTLFRMKLPGSNVLWHMIFLYVMATKRFPEHKNRFFQEIRYLGERAHYFVTLTPYLNPCLVETLSCCFWYVACICSKAYPNNKKNLLRRKDFNSAVILDFYRQVYDADYTPPELLSKWQLWRSLCQEKSSIFPILSHFFLHEIAPGLEEKHFSIILYRAKVHNNDDDDNNKFTLKGYQFLSNLTLQEVLNMYAVIRKSGNNPNYWEDVTNIPKEDDIVLYDSGDESETQLMDHVKINPMTCHPFVECPSSKMYWKDCAGYYNVEKQSYLRLFKRFCKKHERYPKNVEELMCFQNKYVFEKKEYVPEVFSIFQRNYMQKVLEIYKDVMKRYPCEQFMNISNKLFNEDKRKEMDKEYLLKKKELNDGKQKEMDKEYLLEQKKLNDCKII